MSSPHTLAVARSRTPLIVLLAAILGAATSAPVAAQDQRAIINLFGGLIGQAIQQSLRADWAKLPPDQVSCINFGLSRQGASLQQLISAGVPPDDPRLSGLRATCDRIAGTQLKQQVSCPIEGPAGQFVSWCDEDFAQASSDGAVARLGRQDAIRLAFSDQGVSTSLFERADARTRRMQMIADGINSGRVPSPNFDCVRARTDTEQAICRSYQLSALDAEFGDLYQRAHAIDRKGVVLAEANKLYRSGTACNGSEPCINSNTTAGINFMAKFLRDRGQTVVTSIDQKKILAEQADAERRQEEAKQKEDEERVEAERKRQQEAQEDTQRKQKKLEQDRVAAKQLIEDAAAFVKYSRVLNSPTTLAIAEGIASLHASVNADDVDKLEAATASLSSTIHDDKNYSAFKQRQAEDLAIENARRLTDAVQLLKQQQCFLLSYIGDNPTATASAAFIVVAKEIESRLSGTTDLGDIRPLTDKIDALIAQNGLHDRFAISVAGPCKLTPDEREQKQKEDEARRQILAKDQQVAAQLIKDASDFLKYSRKINSPTTLTIAERIAALNGALKAASLEEIESATTTLSNTINDDKNYADFKRQQSEELAQENARKLTDVIQLLSQQECFLLSYITDNPTASASASFLGYSEEIKAARLTSAPDLKEIRTLSERINASIVENGLHDQFAASIATCNGSHDQLVKDQAAAQQLIDEASEFLKYSREINGPNTLAIAQAIASLSGVMDGADAGKLEAATFALSETIHNDKSYTDFSQRQADRDAQENARRLADAIQLIKEQQCFLLSYIAEKPTAPESATFVAQSKEIDTRLRSPSLDEIRPLTEQINASIAQKSVHDQFEVSIAGPCKTTSPEAKALEAKILSGAIEGYGFVILTSASSKRVCATPTVSRDGHQRVVELVVGTLQRDTRTRPISRFYPVG